MLIRKIFAYLPSKLTAAMVILLGLPIYTRLLTPAEYGEYALVLVTAEFVFSILCHWITSGFFRFYHDELESGNIETLETTAISMMFLNIIFIVVIYLIIIYFIPIYDDLKTVMYYGTPLIVGKILLLFQESKHRVLSDIKRYSIMEVGQAVIGFVASLVLLIKFDMDARGILLGMAFGYFSAIFYDFSFYKNFRISAFKKEMLKKLVKYGIPIIIGISGSVIALKMDRFMIEYFLGIEAVGEYSASYQLANGCLSIIFMMICLPLHPVIYQTNATEGLEAAENKLLALGLILLFITLPAAVGIIIVREGIANVLLGEGFREMGVQIIPFITIGFFLFYIKANFFDVIFHLIKRTDLMAWVMIPAAVVNVILNIILIPMYHINGALYATVISFVIAITIGFIISQKHMPISFPIKEMFKIVVSTGVMALFLTMFYFPPTTFGLIFQITVGFIAYIAVSFLLDSMELRKSFLVFLYQTKTK